MTCLGWYSDSDERFGRLGSRPYIQNTNATVPNSMSAPTTLAIASHLTTVSQRRRDRPPAGRSGERAALRAAGAACCAVGAGWVHILIVGPGGMERRAASRIPPG